MKRRSTFGLAIAAAVFVAACGGAATTTTAAETSSTPTAQLAGGVFAYQYESGETVTYRVELDQHITMSAEGDPTVMGEEDFPADVDMSLKGATEMTYEVADGPDEGTKAITVTVSFEDFTAEGTFNGEPIESADEADLGIGALDPIATTFVIDENGKLVGGETAGEDFDALFGVDLAALAELGSPGLHNHLGPVFPDRELSVGDSWEESSTTNFGDQELTVVSKSEVTGTDTVNGVDVFVVESTVETSAFSMDLGEFLREMFSAFGGAADEDEQKEIDDMLSQIEFAIEMQPSTTSAVTWFDPSAGVVVKSTQDQDVTMSMRMNMPDDQTGELVGFSMDMSIQQLINSELVGRGVEGT